MSDTGFLDKAVKPYMRPVVLALLPDTSLDAAARLFRERHIHGAPVVDPAGQVVGVLAQTDLLAALERPRTDKTGHSRYVIFQAGRKLTEGSFPDLEQSVHKGTVEDVMSRMVVAVGTDDTMRSAVERMLRMEVHRVVVMEDARPAGVLSSMDVLRALVPSDGVRDDSGF